MEKTTRKKRFKPNERHIRWNYEKSPDDENLVRYHFIISDDKFRDAKLEEILLKIQTKTIASYPFEKIRRIEGKTEGTEFRYLFVSFDTPFSPKLLDFYKISNNVKRDESLRERTRGNIEDYVESIYSSKNL